MVDDATTDEGKKESRSHLLVFARDWEGYKGMVTLCRYANLYHHHRPIIDLNILRQLADAGVTEHMVATSACPLSDVDKALVYAGKNHAFEKLMEFKGIFPHFFGELMDHRMGGHEFG